MSVRCLGFFSIFCTLGWVAVRCFVPSVERVCSGGQERGGRAQVFKDKVLRAVLLYIGMYEFSAQLRTGASGPVCLLVKRVPAFAAQAV